MEVIRRHTDYALRALVYLAARPSLVVNAAEIAANEDIPLDFLLKILQKFVRTGLVTSHRGAQGGFSLAKDPAAITVLDVVEIMQGKLAMNRCLLGKDGCPNGPRCPLKKSWIALEEKLVNYLAGITLQDLVREQRNIHNEIS
ncbi:MAG: RrF2 family transcriptional regulator [Desulfofundulus sp.]